MQAKFLIFGDSHSIALKKGCDELGIPAIHLSFSGGMWHDGVIIPHRRLGVWSSRPGPARKRIRAKLAEMGVTNFFDLKIPVLGSFGFNLGRFAPPFGWHGHKVYTTSQNETYEDGLVASSQFAEAYHNQYAAGHFRMMNFIHKRNELMMVPPPMIFTRHNARYFYKTITEKIRALNIPLHDPAEYIVDPETQTVPLDLLANDKVHGNAEYGKRVMESILLKYPA